MQIFFPEDWISVWDPDMSSGFQEKFNVRSTPKIFLLDKDKIIIGRDLNTENLEELLTNQNLKQEPVLRKA